MGKRSYPARCVRRGAVARDVLAISLTLLTAGSVGLLVLIAIAVGALP